MKTKNEQDEMQLPDKNEDPWKPWYDATQADRRSWLHMPSGKCPDFIEEWALKNGMTLKWVNVKDDELRAAAYSPKNGPPWAPVLIQDDKPIAFFGRSGVDGHSLGSDFMMGGELQLACMPTKLYDGLQQAIQDETDEISLGLGGQYERKVEEVEGAAAAGSLYAPASRR